MFSLEVPTLVVLSPVIYMMLPGTCPYQLTSDVLPHNTYLTPAPVMILLITCHLSC